jgi:L-alanine-DL-glutamate epimerase-like enolase superfamily enzyme
VSYQQKPLMSRRTALAQAAGAAGLGAIFKMTEDRAVAQARGGAAGQAGGAAGGGGRGRGGVQYGAINKYSAPSDLRITDLRSISITANFNYNIIRMDTNQGVYGLGESTGGVQGIAHAKSLVVGRNPLDITGILESLRIAGINGMPVSHKATSVFDMCLHDVVAKVFGVPVWRLLGDKKRDRIRMYCDTTQSRDPKQFAQKMQGRKAAGFTFFKMDLGTQLIRDKPGAVDSRGVATAKGLPMLCEYLAAVRDAIGWDVPIAADHFGPLDVRDCIYYARAFEPYRLAWAEDILQVGTLWGSTGITPTTVMALGGDAPMNWRAYKQIQDATTTPLAMGESSFRLEEFKDFVDNRAVSVVHPDPQNCGGLHELKRIADYANDTQGIPTATHMVGSPVMAFAAAHCLATIGNFLAVECHAVDFLPLWEQLVTGVSQPIVDNGSIKVPDSPGLGLELNEPVLKEHLRTPGWFESIT